MLGLPPGATVVAGNVSEVPLNRLENISPGQFLLASMITNSETNIMVAFGTSVQAVAAAAVQYPKRL